MSDRSMLVFWSGEAFPYQSRLDFLEDGMVETAVSSLSPISSVDSEDVLFGRADTGECISAFRPIEVGGSKHQTGLGIALDPNGEKKEGHPFRSYSSRVSFQRVFVADEYLTTPNPLVDFIAYRSSNLDNLFLFDCLNGNHSTIQLFENKYIKITAEEMTHSSSSYRLNTRERAVSVCFRFSSAVPFERANSIWVVPIIALLEILAGGYVLPESVKYISNQFRTEFEMPQKYYSGAKIGKSFPSLRTILIPMKIFSAHSQDFISWWMERPNVLKWNAVFFTAAAFEFGYEENHFVTAMRLMEAVYTERHSDKTISALNLPPASNGAVDLNADLYKRVNKALKDADKGATFKEKIKWVCDKYAHYLTSRSAYDVDWRRLSSDARSLRNYYSHGTLRGDPLETDYRKLHALTNVGLASYVFSIIEHIGLLDNEKKQCMKRAREYMFSGPDIADIWPERDGC